MNLFELRLELISKTKWHAPVIDVMDTFDTVCIGLRELCPDGSWTAADAVRLTELIINRAPL